MFVFPDVQCVAVAVPAMGDIGDISSGGEGRPQVLTNRNTSVNTSNLRKFLSPMRAQGAEWRFALEYRFLFHVVYLYSTNSQQNNLRKSRSGNSRNHK